MEFVSDGYFSFKKFMVVLAMLYGACDKESWCVKFQGAKLVKVYAETEEQRSLIESTVKQNKEKVIFSQQRRNFFDSGRRTTVDVLIVASDFWQSWRKNFLQQHNFRWAITEANLGKALKTERLLLFGRRKFKSNEKILSYSYEQVMKSMADMQRSYQSIVQCYGIGKSYEGRNMTVLKVSTGSSLKRKIWIDATIHPREWITTTTILYLIAKIVKLYEDNLEGVRKFDWYFLPLFNPDGYEYSRREELLQNRLWRKNRQPNDPVFCGVAGTYGVDLNRNFDFHWGTVMNRSNCSSVQFEGERPFSTVEAQNVRDEVTRLGDILLYINLHSYHPIGMWLLPYSNVNEWGRPTNYNETKKLAEDAVCAMTGKYKITHPYHVVDYVVSGDIYSWIKKAGIAKHSYSLEIRAEDFLIRDQDQILEAGNDVVAGVLAMLKNI